MSWLFGAGKSNKKKQMYALLGQDHSSDDGFSDGSEDEHVIFRNTEQLELKLYPKARGSNAIRRSKFYCICICLAIALVLLCAVVVTVVLMKIHSAGQDEPPKSAESGHLPVVSVEQPDVNGSDSGDWNASLIAGGEGAIALLDVDGDGLDDILIATMNTLTGINIMDMMDVAMPNFSTVRIACEQRGLKYPCFGEVVAVKGTNGKVLWRLPVRSEAFLSMCEIDIDKDGRKDCISTGRQGMAVAYDPYTPKVLWTAEDDTFMMANWNMYRAVVLPDWNADGVPEVLLTNGGDPTKNEADHDRESGRLVVVSGATGTPMGTRFLAMPNSKETYMSSVIYRPTNTSTDYILFGSGGETVPGDFMAISMYDFCVYIMGETASSVCTKTGDQNPWPGVHKNDIGIITLFRGQKKGVMVPPVVVDVDKDGYMDLVVSVFEGYVVLISGKTLKVVWKAEFPGMESYSTPAPGYFDDDDVLDFMVHWCEGAWDEYYGTTTYVISGANGEIIWTLFSSYYQMTSALIVNQQTMNQDLFLFRLQGRGSSIRYTEGAVITRGDKHNSTRTRRHGKHMLHLPLIPGKSYGETTLDEIHRRYRLMCDEDLSNYTDEVFLMDRSMATKPLLVLEMPMKKMIYNATHHADMEDSSDEFHDDNFDDDDAPTDDDDAPTDDEDIPWEHPDYTPGDDAGEDWQKSDDLPDNAFDGDVDDDGDAGGIDSGIDGGVETGKENSRSDATPGLSNRRSATKGMGNLIGAAASTGSRPATAERSKRHEESDGESEKHDEAGVKKKCVVAKTDTKATGVIADVDGDGRLDYVSVLVLSFDLEDNRYNYAESVYETVIHKVSLEKRYMDGTIKPRHVDAKTSLKPASSASPATDKAGNIFLPMKDQKWTRYFPNDEVYT